MNVITARQSPARRRDSLKSENSSLAAVDTTDQCSTLRYLLSP